MEIEKKKNEQLFEKEMGKKDQALQKNIAKIILEKEQIQEKIKEKNIENESLRHSILSIQMPVIRKNS